MVTTQVKIRCPKCGSEKTVRMGYTIMTRKGRRQRYHCNNCGYTFSEHSEATSS